MKCFIASAFGYADVDKLFDEAIQPALRKSGIESLRVDRVEHNDDIDDKIITLMGEADFCLADLTYARPSVYYEAGFMKGSGKPVVFTARNDHFRQIDSDPLGNLAVHFDLKMKNIIGWKVSDATFRQKLISRIQHVIAPLAKKALEVRKQAADQIAFGRRPIADQLHALEAAAADLLKKNGFGSEDDEANTSRYVRSKGATRLQVVDFMVQRSFNKDTRRLIYSWKIQSPKQQLELHKSKKQLSTTVVCISPFAISRAPFRAYFTTYAESETGALFREYSPRRSDLVATPKHSVKIEFLDRIGSEADFREKFAEVLRRLE